MITFGQGHFLSKMYGFSIHLENQKGKS